MPINIAAFLCSSKHRIGLSNPAKLQYKQPKTSFEIEIKYIVVNKADV